MYMCIRVCMYVCVKESPTKIYIRLQSDNLAFLTYRLFRVASTLILPTLFIIIKTLTE